MLNQQTQTSLSQSSEVEYPVFESIDCGPRSPFLKIRDASHPYPEIWLDKYGRKCTPVRGLYNEVIADFYYIS